VAFLAISFRSGSLNFAARLPASRSAECRERSRMAIFPFGDPEHLAGYIFRDDERVGTESVRLPPSCFLDPAGIPH
jgi:hypothetical protein